MRGVALLAVLGYHGDFAIVRSGYFGLTTFFVLSGFLITTLLLLAHERHGRIDLRDFFRRRGLRLVPAATLGVGFIAAYVAFGADEPVAHVLGDAVASLTGVANWRFIVTEQTYDQILADPSPFQHYWSLAVEQQFYLLLPFLALLLGVARRGRALFVGALATLAAASIGATLLVHDPGDVPLRAYMGTDTRAVELLLGALLACGLFRWVRTDATTDPTTGAPTDVASGPATEQGRAAGRLRTLVVGGVGLVALAATLWSWTVVDGYPDWLFPGGFLAAAAVSAAIVGAVALDGAGVVILLAWRPFVWLGSVSYGIYIFHWPVFLWLDDDLGLGKVPLFAVRVAVTLVLAMASYRLLEHPVRIGRLPAPLRVPAWANASVLAVAVVAVAATAMPESRITYLETSPDLLGPPADDVAAPSTTTGPAPRTGIDAAPSTTGAAAPDAPQPTAPDPTAAPATTAPATGGPGTTATTVPAPAPTAPVASTTSTTAAPPPPLRILVVGDSLGANLAAALEEHRVEHGDIVLANTAQQNCQVSRGGTRQFTDGTPRPIPATCEDFAQTWPAHHANFRPDVTLVVSGVNDVLDRKLDHWDRFYGPGEPTYDDWLVSEFRLAAETIRANGGRTLWVNAPCIGVPDVNPRAVTGKTRIGYLNDVLFPRIRAAEPFGLVDLHDAVCPGGLYTPTVYGVPDARPDTLHFTPEAARAVVENLILPEIRAAAGRDV